MRALTLALFMALPQTLAAEIDAFGSVKGEMSCTVTSMNIISSEEGKPKLYSGVEDKLEQGDTVAISYNSSEQGGFYIGLKDLKRDEIIINSHMKHGALKNLRDDGSHAVFGDSYGDVSFGQDYILIANPGGDFRLKRYYKGDWHGMYIRNRFDELRVQIFTVDCRTVDDEIDAILGLLGSDS